MKYGCPATIDIDIDWNKPDAVTASTSAEWMAIRGRRRRVKVTVDWPRARERISAANT